MERNYLWHIVMSSAVRDFSIATEHSDVRITADDEAVIWYEADAMRAGSTTVLAAAVAVNSGLHEIRLDASECTIQDYLNVVVRPPSMRDDWLRTYFDDTKNRTTRLCRLADFAHKYDDAQIVTICGHLLMTFETVPAVEVVDTCRRIGLLDTLVDSWVGYNGSAQKRVMCSSFAEACITRAADITCKGIIKGCANNLILINRKNWRYVHNVLSGCASYASKVDERAARVCAMVTSIHTNRPPRSDYETNALPVYDWCVGNPVGQRIYAIRADIVAMELDFNIKEDMTTFNDKYHIWPDLNWLA